MITAMKKKTINWDKLRIKHPFHLVKPSSWPMLLSFNLLYFLLVVVTYGMKHGKLEIGASLAEGSPFLALLSKNFLIRGYLNSFVYYDTTIFFHKLMSLFFIVIMGAWF